MASSFNTQGSLSSDPTLALSGGNSTNNFGLGNTLPQPTNILSGLTMPKTPAPTSTAGLLNPTPTNSYTGTSSGILPTTPVKSIADNSGNTVTFHPPATNTQSSSPALYDTTTGYRTAAGIAANAPIAQPGDPSAQPTQTQNNTQTNQPVGAGGAATGTANNGSTGVSQGVLIGNLANQSQAPSQAYTDAQNAATSTLEQETALANDYAQKTNNIANTAGFLTQQNGEQGLLQQQYNTGQSALANQYQGETQQIANANTQQGLEVQAGTAAAGANAPQPYGITTTPYNPSSGTFGTLPNGSTSAAGAGATTAQINQGGTVQTQTGNQAQAQALTTQLTQSITQSGFNSLNGGITTSALNGINQWIQNQSGNPQYQNAYNLINEIASKYSNILNASGGTPTDVSTTTHNIINGLASGQSIEQVIGELDANATQSINALKSSSSVNAENTNTSSTNNTDIYNW